MFAFVQTQYIGKMSETTFPEPLLCPNISPHNNSAGCTLSGISDSWGNRLKSRGQRGLLALTLSPSPPPPHTHTNPSQHEFLVGGERKVEEKTSWASSLMLPWTYPWLGANQPFQASVSTGRSVSPTPSSLCGRPNELFLLADSWL